MGIRGYNGDSFLVLQGCAAWLQLAKLVEITRLGVGFLVLKLLFLGG